MENGSRETEELPSSIFFERSKSEFLHDLSRTISREHESAKTCAEPARATGDARVFECVFYGSKDCTGHEIRWIAPPGAPSSYLKLHCRFEFPVVAPW